MRLYSLAALGASVAFIAAPAFAQNTAHANDSNASNQSQEQGTNNPRQQLIEGLHKAGFTHIRVEPEVFVIHAMNSQGQPVLMRIGPDSMEAVTTMRPNNNGSSSATNGSGQQHASNNNNQSGSTTQ